MMSQFRNFKSGQSAVEFIILAVAVLFFFVIFLVFIQEKVASTNYESLSVALYDVAVSIQEEINLATSSSNGYSRQFNIPKNLNGLNYTVNLTEGSVYAKTIDGKHALILPVSSVQGNLIIGTNYISKINELIYLNP